ncbi:glycosyltransferase [Vibrio sp. 506]|uniref:glycosyltransferase n=1 Tax=Vibrio sp. 506 TaxID=3074607 RepID=UPI002963CBAB|nr:glycosyltransferase [Vibrio sp. 506]MDW2056808.1 glycosyltransferase [Vibrio sp. 506]
MKVLQLSKLFPPFWGGIETVVYDTSVELKNKDIDVDVLCVSDGNKSSVDYIDGIKVFRCSSFLHLASVYLSISYVLRWFGIRNDYDLIHVHLPNPLAMLAMFIFRTKAKIILHWHSDIVKQRFLKIPFIPIQKWLLEKADSIIVTSQCYADASTDLAKYKNKIVVIPIGISDKVLSVNTDYSVNLLKKYPNKKIIFSLGRHVYYKGFEYLVESAKYLPDDYIILIGGVGELTESLKGKINEYNLNTKVKLLGKIPADQLGTYYSCCNVFCLPSIERSEAFGVVQLEAMSFGKPIVSTNIVGSGVPWVNKDGITGKVVPIKDAKALANACVDVVFDNKLKEDNILTHFKNNYIRDIMVDSTLGLYQKVMA